MRNCRLGDNADADADAAADANADADADANANSDGVFISNGVTFATRAGKVNAWGLR